MNLRRWLTPGIGIKRWLLVAFVGLLLLALAAAHVIRQATRDLQPGGVWQVVLDAVTFQFLPYPVRGLLVGVVGGGLFVLGSVRLIRTLMAPFRSSGADQPLVEVIYQKRFLARGPRVVAIGGGTGLSTLLRGLKEHTSNLTAVVTVADDGGSSGMLRTELGIPPVGDIRNCIAALADAEPLMSRLLQYRFPGVDGAASPEPGDPGARLAEQGGLRGHAVGNLLIAALTAVEGGDFEEGVRRMNRVLAVRGQVLPVSPTPLTLHARLHGGEVIDGQSRISRATGIDRVWLTPDAVAASDDALAAIGEADFIVLGPGSLYTSLLPSLLLPQIRDALLASPALRVFVCNVATQRGETSSFDLADHLEALVAHTSPGIVDAVLANNRFTARVPEGWTAEPVRLRWPPAGVAGPRLVLDDIVDLENAHHHDPERLAASLFRLLDREGSRRRAGVARTA
ncbi:MAG TPA: gluconeogenesis factor YvcK family protein [Candidatus Limnocylindrales bacterium]|nr:gluconeogenesis factor YvcK family protein [Candidatus Limnocylindrales bacterium]